MEMRGRAKAAMVIVVRQMVIPSPNQQDLQQRVSCWMDRVEGLSKLPTQLCEAENYYSCGSSSPSLKQTFQLETEAESSKTVIMPVITIGTYNF